MPNCRCDSCCRAHCEPWCHGNESDDEPDEKEADSNPWPDYIY